MASDRARISFDPTRAYRAVVAQQGRVTLEADVNEAAAIQTEALRLETIDLVGPAATPDPPGDGYLVVPGATAEATVIHPGTFYLGGWRLTLDQPVKLGAQPDWLDAPALPAAGKGAGLVALLVTEQSVCAVEDQALREVALGGPDTAARLRLMQRFPLLDLDGDTCAEGSTLVAGLLDADGVDLDPASLQLLPRARLQVGFVPPTSPPDPCQPAAEGGYLGADNQLIRVTVAAFDPNKRAGSLLWGWNNASILYRADLTDKAAGVFTLRGAPIDQEHAPQLGQAVEILRVRSNLGASDVIAADAGIVTTVKHAYSFDDGTLTIADALPAEYLNDAQGFFFVRLWQAITPFVAGQPTPLDSQNGIEVTVDLATLPTNLAARPFWRFAVRPDTPVQVYPRRYQDAPQPPDGPRQWICDLGVVSLARAAAGTLIADCRRTFVPLSDQVDCCCGLTLDPAGVEARGGLQAVADSLADKPAVLTLKPGDYVLRKPLVLTGRHRRLVIEGCGFGASIHADPKAAAAFTFGLIEIDKTDAVTLRRLDFHVPEVTREQATTFVGVLIADSGLITVEDCQFTLEVRAAQATASGAKASPAFGGAIALSGRVAELVIRRNRFVAKRLTTGQTICGVIGAVNTQAVRTALVGVDISDNDFERLSIGVFAFARLGEIRCRDNRIRQCEIGVLLADTQLGVAGAFAKQAIGGRDEALATGTRAGFQAEVLAASANSQAAFLSRGDAAGDVKVTASVRKAVRKDVDAAGLKLFQGVAAAPEPTETGPAPKTEAAATADKAESATARATVEAGTRNAFLTHLDTIDGVSVTAQATAVPLNASIHITGNEVVLAKKPAQAAAGAGVALVLSPSLDHGHVVMSANRVACPDARTAGASLLFATAASVTGNLLFQEGVTDDERTLPVFIALGVQGGAYAITGNVFHRRAMIRPVRSSPQPSPDWAFFNSET